MRGLGRADIVNAGSGESRYSECRVLGRADIVNAGSKESGYSECRCNRVQRESTRRPKERDL
ncbi:unnamed protein product, partial [Staurois parvus]